LEAFQIGSKQTAPGCLRRKRASGRIVGNPSLIRRYKGCPIAVTRSASPKLREAASQGGGTPLEVRAASAAAMLISACRQRTDRNVTSIRIPKRDLVRSSVRVEVRFLFELADERAGPLKCQVEIIDAEEQQEAIAGFPVIGASSMRDARGHPIYGGRARQFHPNRGSAQSSHGQEG
jgi:hypothetical protein